MLTQRPHTHVTQDTLAQAPKRGLVSHQETGVAKRQHAMKVNTF